MNNLANAVRQDIECNFNQDKLDEFLSGRSTVRDLILHYFYIHKDIYTNDDLFSLCDKDYLMLCNVLDKKFLHYLKIDESERFIMLSLCGEEPLNFSSLKEIKTYYIQQQA